MVLNSYECITKGEEGRIDGQTTSGFCMAGMEDRGEDW